MSVKTKSSPLQILIQDKANGLPLTSVGSRTGNKIRTPDGMTNSSQASRHITKSWRLTSHDCLREMNNYIDANQLQNTSCTTRSTDRIDFVRFCMELDVAIINPDLGVLRRSYKKVNTVVLVN